MTHRLRLSTALAVMTIVMSWAGAASAASWLELNFYLSGPRYDGRLPPCEDGLDRIKSNFEVKEGRFWNSNLKIVDFDRVKEEAFRPWAPDTIPRRFCRASALISDGKWRSVYYSIGEDTGFVGAGWGVEWCVVGLDRNWAYNPVCKSAKP
jgi:hypothetical protein